MSKQTEITIKEGHLGPKGSKEVMIENDRWELSVWVTDHEVQFVINHDSAEFLLVDDTDNGERLTVSTNSLALRFKPSKGGK